MTINLKKYKWKNRILLVETPNYNNKDYIKTRDLYEKNIKNFHKRYVKKLNSLNKSKEFKIKLIGFDGEVKKEFQKLEVAKIFKIIDKMPLGKMMKKNSKIKPNNLSLFSDYNKETTVPGLGFKDKEKAIYTLDKIKDKPIKYQISVVNTMIGRAKSHPHKTDNMEEAIKIFQKWLDNYKLNK